MELTEWLRRLKRNLDGYFTCRRTLFLIILICALILYLSPYFTRRFTVTKTEDFAETCLNARLSVFHQDIEEFNANLQHIPVRDREKAYIPWVGNGVLGVELVSAKRVVHIRHGRTLSLPVMFEPLVEVAEEEYGRQEAIVAHYLTGIVHRIQCFNSGLMVAQQYYAHRSIPAVLVQDIKVTNPNDEPVQISTRQTGILNWPSANSHKLRCSF